MARNEVSEIGADNMMDETVLYEHKKHPAAKTGMVAARINLEALAVSIEREELWPNEAAAKIREIVKKNLHRRKPLRAGRAKDPKCLTFEMRNEIIAAKMADPKLTYMALGHRFDVNISAVSLALRGDRE